METLLPPAADAASRLLGCLIGGSFWFFLVGLFGPVVFLGILAFAPAGAPHGGIPGLFDLVLHLDEPFVLRSSGTDVAVDQVEAIGVADSAGWVAPLGRTLAIGGLVLFVLANVFARGAELERDRELTI